MEFLKYSNETQTNIFPKENFEALVHDVFNVISTNICRSLGPLGSSATILQGLTEPEATKDGYAILDKYAFRNDYKRMIYHLIKTPCTKMNNIVGDGTTTAIALTNALFNRYQSSRRTLEALYRLPRQFTKMWDSVIAELQEKIKEKATPIDPKDYDTIYKIAYVTSNGNDEVSKNIAKVYSEAEAPFIKQKDSLTNKSYIETVEGFNMPANLISDAYARNEDMTAEENDFYVMVFDFKIETDIFEDVLVPINNVLRSMGRKLLVIAPAYDGRMCDTVVAQYTMKERISGNINMILTQYSPSHLGKHQLLDLCAVMKCKVVNENIYKTIVETGKDFSIDEFVDKVLNDPEFSLTRIIGRAKYGLLSTTAGCLLRAEPDIYDDDYYKDTLASAKNELNALMSTANDESNSYSVEVHKLRDRILQLEMKNFIYYVGADSRLQKNILWDSIMDVIKCTRSAVRCGVVPGCQLSIIRSCNELLANVDDADEQTDADKLRRVIIDMIRCACVDVYAQVLNGPDGMGMVKLLPRWQFTSPEGTDALIEEANKKCVDYINQSIEKNCVFDMESLEFNNNIITSAETDQLVLLAASELIKVLISGNQAIIIREAADSSHEETRNM